MTVANEFSDEERELHFRAFKIAGRLVYAIQTGDRDAAAKAIAELVALLDVE